MNNFWKRNYKNSWNFLKESKNYIFFALGIFLLFFIIGFIFPVFFREQIAKRILELIDSFADKNLFETIIKIFFNNLSVSFFAMISGILFGIIPLIITIVNGYVIGFVSREAVNIEGGRILWRLVPHGIFEIPAIMISIGIGLKIGTCFFSHKKSLKIEVKKALIFFLFVVVPLLLIAAIIESFLIFFVK